MELVKSKYSCTKNRLSEGCCGIHVTVFQKDSKAFGTDLKLGGLKLKEIVPLSSTSDGW
jgi:hypothetical protein